MNPRNERLKQAIARLAPSGVPADALANGLYIEEPDHSFADRTLARLDLYPKSSHLLLGPSGIGKSTQLLVLARKLRERNELVPLFVDATAAKVDLQQRGSLITHLALNLKRILVDEMAGDDMLARIVAAFSVGSPKNTSAEEILRQLPRIKRKLVLLLDSYDHLPVQRFGLLCSEDLASLKQHMAIVAVGPLAMTSGPGHSLAEHFDFPSRQPIYNPALGGTMHAFFMRLLGQRVDEDLLPAECCARLVDASGGVPRDLLALAQLALEESFVAGYNCVEPDDVTRAIARFGQKHIAGLDSDDLARLNRVRKTGTLAPRDNRAVNLLATRRILEYISPAGGSTFAVHPALIPLIGQPDPLESL